MEQAATMSHQAMGYDRTSTMFSPDGRLLQVEYAKKTIRQGSTAIGIVCKDGVLLITDKRITNKLIVNESVEKLFQIDAHIGDILNEKWNDFIHDVPDITDHQAQFLRLGEGEEGLRDQRCGMVAESTDD